MTIRELAEEKRKAQAAAAAAAPWAAPCRTLPDDGTSLLTDRDMAEIFGCSRSSIWRYVSLGVLPRPLKIGNLSRWRSDVVRATIEAATAERDASEVA